jgi:hypothetical protein
MVQFFQSKRFIQGLAIVLIVVGLLFAVRYIRGTLNTFREMSFAANNDFDAGNLDVELIRPWMSIRYIAEAYAVPQLYIFEQINIPMERHSNRVPLQRLNTHERLGQINDEPVLVDMVREAIADYRRTPVVTGLAEERVQPWMNMQYIANSTGIPVEQLFAEVGLAVDGYAYMPLDKLVGETGYKPDVEHLIRTLQRVVDAHEVNPE